MQVFTAKKDLRVWLSSQKAKGKSVGFVPTMGALHAGHQALMKHAKHETDVVVISIFVNPTQFGPNEDFSRYPRSLEADCELASDVGVDAIFAPNAEEVYHEKQFIHFSITDLNKHLCGKSRPGHFEGVCQIVNKLFNIVQPDKAFFGKKDIQQCIILKTMVKEMDLPVEIVLAETVRETDGLALSSRNRYLDAQQREIAPNLYKQLVEIKTKILAKKSPISEIQKAKLSLEQIGFRIDYIELVNELDLQPVYEIQTGKTYILALAAFLGQTRLIDNIHFTNP